MLDAIEGAAAGALSAQEVVAFVEAAHYSYACAGSLVANTALPEYLLPWIKAAPLAEVWSHM